MPPKKSFHDTTGKKAHKSEVPPPIYNLASSHEDFASVQGKSTGDSTYDSSEVDDQTLDTTTSQIGLADTMVGENSINWTLQLIAMANLGTTSVNATVSIRTTIFGSAAIIIPPLPGLLGFPWSQTTGYMSSTLLLR